MRKNHWLEKLKQSLRQSSSLSDPAMARRRPDGAIADPNLNTLERRIMLSAQAAFAAPHGFGSGHSNTLPAITGITSPVTYVEGSVPVLLASGAQINDASTAFSGSTLTVQLAFHASSTSTSALSIVAGNGVTLSTGSVLYNGTAIGTVTGGTSGAALVVNFNSSATQAGVQAVLDQVGYSNSSSTTPFGCVPVAFQFTDGSGASSHTVLQEVKIVSPAAITNINLPATYSAGGAATPIVPTAQVTDTNGAFANSSLSVQFAPVPSSTTTNVLSIVAGNGVTLSSGSVLYNGTAIGTVTGGTAGAPLVVAFNSSATQTGIQAVLDQVSYSNTNASVNPGGRAVILKFTDGTGFVSAPAFQLIQITPAALVSNLGPPVQYVAGGGPILIAPAASVTDTANAFANSTLNIQLLPTQSATSTDVLSILTGGGVTVSSGTVSYNGTAIGTVTGGTAGAALVVKFNASATQVGVQAVLDEVAYSNSSSSPTPARRGIDIQFTDGNGSAAWPAFQKLQILSSPAITGIAPSVSYVHGSSPVALAGNAQLVDNAGAYANSTLTVKFAGGSNSASSTDVLSIIAANGVTVSSGSVLYNGTAIGTVTGGTAGAALTIAFNASATQAGAQAVLNDIAYSNTNTTTLKRGERDVTFQFSDGAGSASQVMKQDVYLS